MIPNDVAKEIIDYIHDSLAESKSMSHSEKLGWFRQTLEQVQWRLRLILGIQEKDDR